MAFRSHLPEPPPTGAESSVVPPPVVGHTSRAPLNSSDSPAGALPVIEATPGHRSKSDAAGWMTSLLLHTAIVVVVWLLVAPANLGGVNAIVISMSWSDDETEQSTTWIADVKAIEPAIEPPAEPIAPAPAVLPDFGDVAMDNLAGGGGGDGNSDLSSDATGAGSSVGGKTSPRGTFFGIEAYGHDFVYVVDMSGSMKGHLYDRAIAELIRSVDQLNPTQKFYVTLFSDRAKAMFDDTSVIPETISATPENRERLAKWLTEAYDGGGTDPRKAVKLALDMKPSAVFMLSDGEFKERRQKDAGVLLAGDASTTAAVVRTTNTTIPIHSIAFENEVSRNNMQELANLTNGTFRFVAAEDRSKRISESLAEINEATKLGHHHVAQVFWNELIHTVNLAAIDEELRQEVVDLVVSRGEKASVDEHAAGVSLALRSLVEMDPNAEFTLEQQTQLLKQCQQIQSTSGDQVDPRALSDAMMTQAELIQRYPKAKISQILKRTMSDQLFEQADRLAASDDIAGVFRLYDRVRSLRMSNADRDESLKRQKMIVEDQIAIAEQKEEKEGTLAFVVHLVDVFESSGNTWLDLGGRDALQNASMRMHAALRDASTTKGVADRMRLQNEIKTASQRSPVFARAAVDFVRSDRMARGVMNQARRNEQRGLRKSAIKQYEKIVQQYPYSRSIHFARERLVALTGQPLKQPGDDAKTIQADSTFLDQFNEMFSAKPSKDSEIAQPTESEEKPADEAGSLEWLLEISESE